MKDTKTGLVYKLPRRLGDQEKIGLKYGFDARSDIPKNQPVNHPDSHIPADEWINWEELWQRKK